MKGLIIAIILSILVFWSLGQKTPIKFFRIKRRRIERVDSNYEIDRTNVGISKVPRAKPQRRKQRRRNFNSNNK